MSVSVVVLTPLEALRRNHASYEVLLDRLVFKAQGNVESRLRCAETLAEFCQFNHPGRFADGSMENAVLAIGEEEEFVRTCRQVHFPGWKLFKSRNGRSRHVLHIATSVLEIGGHTRTIKNWIRLDGSSRHSLLVIAQGQDPIPHWIHQAVESSDGECIELPSEAPLTLKAAWVRALAHSGPDLIILHTFGSDSVCLAALSTPDSPPVALVNHADHLFWMGGTIADVIVNQRRVGMELSTQRRHARQNCVLPIPLEPKADGLDRQSARDHLNITDDRVMLVSVGRASKFAPTKTHNFFQTVSRILDSNPQADLFLIGVSAEDIKRHANCRPHERLHALGPLDDATYYHAAADAYLEGFPFGSQTALLEAALAGVPVVRAFTPPLPLLATQDDAIEALAPVPPSEDAYVTAVSALVADSCYRKNLGRRLRQAVRAEHEGPEWEDRLTALYRCMSGGKHAPRELPQTCCEETRTDVALAGWQATRELHGCVPSSASQVSDVLFLAAYNVRRGGAYRRAASLLARSASTGGLSRRLLQAGFKLLPQYLIHRWRTRSWSARRQES